MHDPHGAALKVLHRARGSRNVPKWSPSSRIASVLIVKSRRWRSPGSFRGGREAAARDGIVLSTAGDQVHVGAPVCTLRRPTFRAAPHLGVLQVPLRRSEPGVDGYLAAVSRRQCSSQLDRAPLYNQVIIRGRPPKRRVARKSRLPCTVPDSSSWLHRPRRGASPGPARQA